MKKLLYGTTALVAVGLVADSAIAAEKISLGLGGYWRGVIAVGENENDASPSTVESRSHGIGRESEIYFSGKTTLDNGIQFGVMMQLEGETSADQMDNSYIWASGGFGRIELGETWGPSLLMSYGTVGDQIDGHGDFGSQNHVTNFNGLGINTYGGDAGLTFTPIDKIQYFTPRISGFQLGVSYQPDNKNATLGNNASGAALNSELNGSVASELLDVGANYTTKFGDASVAVFGAYATASAEATAVGGAANEDQDTTSFGAQVSFAGFTVGGRWTGIDNYNGGASGAELDRETWRIGMSYKMGAVTLGIAHMVAEQDVAGTTQEDETTYTTLGADYNLGPGIKLFGGVQLWDHDDATNALASEGDNTVGVFGTKLSF
jgi:outer membrane protein OmpU